MKKYATLFLVFMMFTSFSLFSQSPKETSVKLEWHEQGFVHFYSPGYSVYVSKPDFLNIQNELLVGLFDEYAQKEDSISLANPFSVFKSDQQSVLWDQLKACAAEGHMLILPVDSKKKLKNVVIIDGANTYGKGIETWECRDPRTNRVIFAHNKPGHMSPDF
jgi:hypothetical protein